MKEVSWIDPLPRRQFPRAATPIYPGYFTNSPPIVKPLGSAAHGSDNSVINLTAQKCISGHWIQVAGVWNGQLA